MFWKCSFKLFQVEVPHPLDINFGLLNCDLKHIDSSSNTYKVSSSEFKFLFISVSYISFHKIKEYEIKHSQQNLLELFIYHSVIYQFIETYVEKTKSYGSPKILDIWEVDRQDEVSVENINSCHKKQDCDSENKIVARYILRNKIRL